jgi:hypothetical protein
MEKNAKKPPEYFNLYENFENRTKTFQLAFFNFNKYLKDDLTIYAAKKTF